MVAAQNRSIRGAVGATAGPGRSARVWPAWDDGELPAATRQALYEALHAVLAPHTSVASLVWPRATLPCPHDDFRRAGYRQVAEIECLTAPLDATSCPTEPLPFTLSAPCAPDDPLLQQIYADTLVDSHDCAGWSDPRAVPDVLRAMGGERHMRAYHLFWREAAPMGCLVMSHDGLQDHADLEYVGLVPAVRGQRWGTMALQYVWQIALAWGCKTVGVSVDRDNLPAIRTYARGQFHPGPQQTLYAAIL